MRFEPQIAGQLLVNDHHRPANINIALTVGVAAFLYLGIVGVICASQLAGNDGLGSPPAMARN